LVRRDGRSQRRARRARALEGKGALMRNDWRSLAAALAVLALLVVAAPARAADEAAAGAPAAAEPPAVPLTTADLKGITTPSADDLAKGDQRDTPPRPA